VLLSLRCFHSAPEAEAIASAQATAASFTARRLW
jgi:hypothetical protein